MMAIVSENMTLARPYAKAVFGTALENNTLATWSHALKILASIVANKEMQPILTHPRISKDQLADIVLSIAADLPREGKHLLNLLVEKKRLALLPVIATLYETFVRDHEKTIEVKVDSAYPIDPVRLQRLKQALQTYLKRQVSLHCTVNTTLLGGAIIYADHQVIDGSVRNKLKRLSESLCGLGGR
jgi:F-type H+-transporting ATPase subunit delta